MEPAHILAGKEPIQTHRFLQAFVKLALEYSNGQPVDSEKNGDMSAEPSNGAETQIGRFTESVLLERVRETQDALLTNEKVDNTRLPHSHRSNSNFPSTRGRTSTIHRLTSIQYSSKALQRRFEKYFKKQEVRKEETDKSEGSSSLNDEERD